MAVCLWVQDAADEVKKEDSKKEDVKIEVKEEKPKLVASDPAAWPQPEAGQVVEGVKWMAKVRRRAGGGQAGGFGTKRWAVGLEGCME
jgi:hypothetical protein